MAPVDEAKRKEYRRRLAAGRKLAHEKKWREACLEFEAALTEIPLDARALSELGWASFHAGDHARSREANGESVRVSADPKVKAASLYNLGRLAEADGDREAAIELYRSSLALRPNQDVAARLAALDAPAEAPPPPLPCTEPQPLDKLCGCLGTKACRTERHDEALGLRIVRVEPERGTQLYWLAARGGGGWQVVARLAEVFHPGGSVVEEIGFPEVAERAVGGRRVLWLVGEHDHWDSDPATYEVESSQEKLLTLCVLGDGKQRPTCPLQVPLMRVYKRWREEGLDEAKLDAETRALLTPGLPIMEKLHIKVDLSDDGTANVLLVDGEPDDRLRPLIGERKLW